MKYFARPALCCLLIISVVLLTGCGRTARPSVQPAAPETDSLGNDLQRAVSSLLVNVRALDTIHDNLHNAAADEAGRSTDDVQLGYIRKTALYVQQARTVSYYQARLLSNYAYIKASRQTDFLTLRALDLDQGGTALEDAAGYLEVYAAFIEQRQALAEIEKARMTILGTIYLYEGLLDLLKPVVNPSAPFSRDPYGPFSRGTRQRF